MATSNKTFCKTCDKYVVKFKRHMGQVHQDLSNERSQSILLLAKLSKKATNDRQYSIADFSMKTVRDATPQSQEKGE